MSTIGRAIAFVAVALATTSPVLESDPLDQVRGDGKRGIRVVEAHMSAEEIAESRRLAQASRPQEPTRLRPN